MPKQFAVANSMTINFVTLNLVQGLIDAEAIRRSEQYDKTKKKH
jgi:hypothetical protein